MEFITSIFNIFIHLLNSFTNDLLIYVTLLLFIFSILSYFIYSFFSINYLK